MFRAHWESICSAWALYRIRAARAHLDGLLDRTPRYWRAAAIGGGSSIGLGRITKDQAFARARETGLEIAFIDRENAFITLVDARKRSGGNESA